MSSLNEAVQNYLDKGIPLEKLVLYIPTGFISPQQQSVEIDEEDNEHINTQHGHVRIVRTNVIETPVLSDIVNTITIRHDNKVVYR